MSQAIYWLSRVNEPARLPAGDARPAGLRDHDGAVSMVGTNLPVAGVVRLGPVFTPLQARRRGYASALVADVSRRALAAGATRCMLYTDLGNVTSNNIYQAVGYRRSNDANGAELSPSATSNSWANATDAAIACRVAGRSRSGL